MPESVCPSLAYRSRFRSIADILFLRQHPAMKRGYNSLMREVCVDRGWCGGIVDGEPSHVDFFIPDSGPVTVDQFVDWLFLAENMDPTAEPEKWQSHKDGLRQAFLRHMGSAIVDASALKWDVS